MSASLRHRLDVDLGSRSYPIYIGEGLLDDPAYLHPHIGGRQVMIVSNETVAPLYLDRLLANLQGYDCVSHLLPDGERFKDLAHWQTILDALLGARFDRGSTVIALGGGVVGDMAGFAAACYQRGVGFIQVPTTLLSQVDSSVGGKTGVNHPLGKNMIGAFYQPQCVIADTEVLNTLDDRQLSAGLAEVIKYGLIRDAGFFGWLEHNMSALLNRDADALAYAISESCKCKAEIVAADEHEGGVRALLNLGHTFGHAIETGVGYGEWLHGEAVGAGMVLAGDLSRRLGMMSRDALTSAVALIERARLPIHPPAGMGPERFLELMAIDKKVRNGRLNLILLEDIGRGVIRSDFDPEVLKECLTTACRE
ncbi:MAG: 3-dehydroquinate synthase [Gammaproteobacteria bacterium]|nr:3-dehydroquinate synthase [Gammaproteobacteria bacterium]